VARVAGQNPLQQRRPGTHHADHHQRTVDSFIRDLGMPGEPVHRAQAGGEAAADRPPQDGRPDCVERRVRQGREQHAERGSEGVVPEIRQTRRLASTGEKGSLVEGFRGVAGHERRLLLDACRIP
jgi:hypothetical protein